MFISNFTSDLLNCFVLKKMLSKNKSIEKLISKVANKQYFIERSGLRLKPNLSTNKLFNNKFSNIQYVSTKIRL